MIRRGAFCCSGDIGQNVLVKHLFVADESKTHKFGHDFQQNHLREPQIQPLQLLFVADKSKTHNFGHDFQQNHLSGPQIQPLHPLFVADESKTHKFGHDFK